MLHQVIQILSQRGPLHRVFDVALLFPHPLFHRVVERSHRGAFAKNFQRHALANAALRVPILDKRFVRPTEHIDEAGGNGEAPCVDFFFAMRALQFSDGSNILAVDRNISSDGRLAAAVIDCAMTN